MKLWLWLVCGLLAVVLFGGLAVGNVVTTSRARNRCRVAAKAACAASPAARQPVFVMLVARGNAESAAAVRAVVSAFERATCPLRVYVGVAEYVEGGSGSGGSAAASAALAPFVRRFEAAAKSSAIPFKLSDHVRVLRAPLQEFEGYAVAREQVQRFLYRGEPYVAALGVTVVVKQNWDAVLQAAVNDLPPRSVVTTIPARAVADNTRFLQMLDTHVALPAMTPGGLASSLTGLTGLANPGPLPGGPSLSQQPTMHGADAMGSFVAVARCGDATGVTLAPYAMRVPMGTDAVSMLPRTVRALVWSPELSMCKGPMPLIGGGSSGSHGTSLAAVSVFAATAETDTTSEAVGTTGMLVDLGWTLHHPTGVVASTVPAFGVPPSTNTALPATVSRLSGSAQRFLGLRLGAGSVENRARLGLAPAPNPTEEVAVKIGSVGDVLSTLSRIELQASAANSAAHATKHPKK
jgi:hypothetical protein